MTRTAPPNSSSNRDAPDKQRSLVSRVAWHARLPQSLAVPATAPPSPPQVSILGSAEPWFRGIRPRRRGRALLVNSSLRGHGCGSPATRSRPKARVAAGGLVLNVVPLWTPCLARIAGHGGGAPMGWAMRNLLMALSADACIVIGGRAGTISEVCWPGCNKAPAAAAEEGRLRRLVRAAAGQSLMNAKIPHPAVVRHGRVGGQLVSLGLMLPA